MVDQAGHHSLHTYDIQRLGHIFRGGNSTVKIVLVEWFLLKKKNRLL